MALKMLLRGPVVSGEFRMPNAKQALMEIDGFDMINGPDSWKVFNEEGQELTKEQLADLASAESAAVRE